jgi:hypothetical protein
LIFQASPFRVGVKSLKNLCFKVFHTTGVFILFGFSPGIFPIKPLIPDPTIKITDILAKDRCFVQVFRREKLPMPYEYS